MNGINGDDILRTLIELLEAQENIKITYEIKANNAPEKAS